MVWNSPGSEICPLLNIRFARLSSTARSHKEFVTVPVRRGEIVFERGFHVNHVRKIEGIMSVMMIS